MTPFDDVGRVDRGSRTGSASVRCAAVVAALLLAAVASVSGQRGGASSAPSTPPSRDGVTAGGQALPAGYVVGIDDVLSIVFWRDKEMSADVVVRPDGKISLPLLNDLPAAGMTPDQLRTTLVAAAAKFLEEPNATVVVKEIRSRKVFITGNVAKPATYALNGEMTVLQLIAVAGGLLEYADSKNIVIIRTEGAQQSRHKFNYRDVTKEKGASQNISLKPGDTVIVP